MKKFILFIILINFTITQAQIVNIPDANFKNALIGEYVDINNDGEIQNSEAENVYFLNISQQNISSLTGIEAFTNLRTLDCYNNPLGSLNISSNINLTKLTCGSNQLSSLNVSNNTNLTHLNFNGNHLTSLDISNNINLTHLKCENNQLVNLNVSNNINLIKLNCYYNRLHSLDVSNNPNLTHLFCENNLIDNLNISNATNLIFLNCRYNQLNNLDVSTNINLEGLYCYDNELVSLNVSNNINLTQLKCNSNPNLTYINLKNGNNGNYNTGNISDFTYLPNLQTVCVDALNTSLTDLILSGTGHSVNFSVNCSTTSLNGHEVLIFSIYPTPTDNILNIKAKTEISKIEIYNQLGQLILNETENSIEISNLPNGLYLIKAEDINGNFGVKKIIKN